MILVMKRIPLLFTYLFFMTLLVSQVNANQGESESNFEYTKRVHKELDQLREIKPERYIEKVDSYRVTLEKYIENKKRVCNGEFSTIVLGQQSHEAKCGLRLPSIEEQLSRSLDPDAG